MKKNADRFVHAIFCDDMRQEMGNKLSFMGCYQGEMFVPFVPLTLPKFCVSVTVVTPVVRPFRALTIRVNQGGNLIATIETASADWAQAVPPSPGDATSLGITVGVMLAPFVILEPSEIRVMVTTEEGEILGPRLHIKVAPPAPVGADAIAAIPTDKAKPKAAAKMAKMAMAKRAPVKRG